MGGNYAQRIHNKHRETTCMQMLPLIDTKPYIFAKKHTEINMQLYS